MRSAATSTRSPRACDTRSGPARSSSSTRTAGRRSARCARCCRGSSATTTAPPACPSSWPPTRRACASSDVAREAARRARVPRVLAVAGRHRTLTVVLAGAVVLRALSMMAYGPALFFSDSWAYLSMAWDGGLVKFAPDRPAGYPLVIHLLGPAGHALWPLVALQHLAGLATGVIVYALCLHRGVSKWLAAAAAAVVLLGGATLAVEQQIMPEAFFTLALVAALALVVWRPRDTRVLVASGLLLAGAVT